MRSAAAAIRLLALALRLVLVVLLARFLPVESVGAYGLIAATVTFLVYLVGFDFYTYANREYIRAGGDRRRTILKSHAVFVGLLYVAVIPGALIFAVLGLASWNLILWTCLLLPLEHLGSEVDRLLIISGKSTAASVSLFVRQGLLTLVLFPLMAFAPELRHLETVLICWIVFGFIGILFGLNQARISIKGLPGGFVDWSWIRKGIAVGGLFLIGTLSLRLFFTLDRQVLAARGDLTILGAYTFFSVIGTGISAVIYASAHQFSYPQLIHAAREGATRGEFISGVKKLALLTVVSLSALSIFVLISIRPILLGIGQEIYLQHASVMNWVLVITALYNLSLIPHYALYALKRDKSILIVTLLATTVFVLLLVIQPIRESVLNSVLVSLMVGFALLLLGKSLLLWHSLRISRDTSTLKS